MIFVNGMCGFIEMYTQICVCIYLGIKNKFMFKGSSPFVYHCVSVLSDLAAFGLPRAKDIFLYNKWICEY